MKQLVFGAEQPVLCTDDVASGVGLGSPPMKLAQRASCHFISTTVPRNMESGLGSNKRLHHFTARSRISKILHFLVLGFEVLLVSPVNADGKATDLEYSCPDHCVLDIDDTRIEVSI